MSLFQSTVVTKYLNSQDPSTLQQQFQIFQNHFHNPEIQENIRNSKEEQYQGEFLIDLFVNVLGYTKNPIPNFNLTTEYKNVKDSKKADGAIIFMEEVKAVIELKGTETTDLAKVEAQAFGYKNNQPKCKYVITSNFEKLRLYIDNATEHIEFNLFTLGEEDFGLFYLCLAKENIEKNIPQKIKNESLSRESEITKQLYKDYSLFKRELHKNLVPLNPQFDPLTLFKKSQKLLDRFLFLFFAEDRALLPPNSVRLVLSDWKELQERDVEVALYERFKKYFGYLNSGFKGKRYDVYPYNGGLFKPDEVLDAIIIDDTLLYYHTLKLSEYDFASEVDVNILGHIFENSLTEIEEVEAELKGEQNEKSKSKRKKDGVFYTPKYITKYIVENTVGKLCEQKKAEFDITDDNYQPAKQRSRKRIQNLQEYRDWLLGITICDPACGSGAFLNQALEFLITEHRYIDELSAKYNKDAFILSDVENSILENNLFGVDINEESVEIAKLSLWLRTAQKNRKLNDLSNNIKCGNSLIDDEEFAGSKAFKWHEEFKTVFADSGFDVVIGNPPYLNLTKNNTPHKYLSFYNNNFKSIRTSNSKNLYTLFNELSLQIIKEGGYVSFIIPEGFLKTRSYEDCVNVMRENGKIQKAVYFEDWVFEDATTGSMIFEFVKNNKDEVKQEEFLITKNREILRIETSINPVLEKYKNLRFQTVNELCELFKGMAVKNRNEFLFTEKGEFTDKFLLGNCIDRYIVKNEFYCNYNDLTIVGGTKNKDKHDISPRILIRRTGNYLCCVMLKERALTESTLYSCSLKTDEISLYSLLAIFNSKYLTYIVRQNMITNEQAFPQILMSDLQLLKIPIPNVQIQKILEENSLKIEASYQVLDESTQKFIRNVDRNFHIEKLPKKLENWHGLTFDDFLKELKKKKVVLSLTQQAEWEEYFLQEQQKANAIKNEIDKLDAEIDALVYSLYELTEDEIKIVEAD